MNLSATTLNDSLPAEQFMSALAAASAERLVLVDFQASWCSPCRALLPVLEAIAEEYPAELQLVTVDAEQREDLLQQLVVRGLPTVILVLNGREVTRFTKALPEADIRKLLKPYVGRNEQQLERLAQAAFDAGNWATGVQLLEQLMEFPTAGAREMAQLCHRMMDSLPEAPELRPRLQSLIDNVATDWLRDPAMQHAISRWQLVQRLPKDLDKLRQQYRQQPSESNRLALAEALASQEQWQDAISLLMELFASIPKGQQSPAARSLMIELLNTMPDRALANGYRRQWLAVERSGSLPE